MQLHAHLQETVGTLLAESQWTCTGKRKMRVVCPPHSCTADPSHAHLISYRSSIAKSWMARALQVPLNTYCLLLFVFFFFSSKGSSDWEGEGHVTHTATLCYLTSRICARVQSSPLTHACIEVQAPGTVPHWQQYTHLFRNCHLLFFLTCPRNH